ncbi:MAG: hypothetical protein Q9Q13_04470 [Acidobacteriota bacterium]|nr:hypothetical protein [Acidobacteriota bacterium]
MVETPPRPDALERQVLAALEMLAEDPWVDPAGITLVGGASLLPLAAEPPGRVRVVLVLEGGSTAVSGTADGVEVVAGGWNSETLGALAERLAD